jgi:hypothetical protein
MLFEPDGETDLSAARFIEAEGVVAVDPLLNLSIGAKRYIPRLTGQEGKCTATTTTIRVYGRNGLRQAPL